MGKENEIKFKTMNSIYYNYIIYIKGGLNEKC